MALTPSAALRHFLSFRFCGSALLLLAALPLLSSCADSTPETDIAAAAGSTLTVPEEWRNVSLGAGHAKDAQSDVAVLDKEALKQWWTQFDDPVLDALIDAALQSSPSIRTALSRIDESRARRGVAFSGLLPVLSGNVSGRGSETRNHNTHSSSSSENYSASLDASWEIDLFGKQRLAYDAATADWEQSQENFYAAQVSLAAEVAQTYVELRAAQAQLDVLRRNIAARAQTTELTQWRADAGEASEMDAQQALSTLEQARAGIPSVELTQALARNSLTLLCGLTPGALDGLLDTQRPVPVAGTLFAVDIPAETLRQRPDVRAAEKGLLAAMLRTRSTERERLPSLNLSGSIGIEALKAGNLFSPDATIASIVGSLSAPLFQGGRIMQNIAISEALREQALISYELTVLTALSEVENALISVRQNSDRLEIVRRAATAATLAATLAAQRYEAGQADLLTVLEAQRTQLSLEEQQVSTSASLTTSHIQLYKSLGGGWSVTAEKDARGAMVAAEKHTVEPTAATSATAKATASDGSVSTSEGNAPGADGSVSTADGSAAGAEGNAASAAAAGTSAPEASASAAESGASAAQSTSHF